MLVPTQAKREQGVGKWYTLCLPWYCCSSLLFRRVLAQRLTPPLLRGGAREAFEPSSATAVGALAIKNFLKVGSDCNVDDHTQMLHSRSCCKHGRSSPERVPVYANAI